MRFHLEDFNLRTHLSQLGMNRLARHHCRIPVVELLERLKRIGQRDLRDETTRSHLVLYVHEVLSELKKQNELGFNPTGFDIRGGFYLDLSSDNNTFLYPTHLVSSLKPLELPFLYDAKVVDASTLATFDPIVAAACLKLP